MNKSAIFGNLLRKSRIRTMRRIRRELNENIFHASPSEVKDPAYAAAFKSLHAALLTPRPQSASRNFGGATEMLDGRMFQPGKPGLFINKDYFPTLRQVPGHVLDHELTHLYQTRMPFALRKPSEVFTAAGMPGRAYAMERGAFLRTDPYAWKSGIAPDNYYKALRFTGPTAYAPGSKFGDPVNKSLYGITSKFRKVVDRMRTATRKQVTQEASLSLEDALAQIEAARKRIK